MKTRAKFYVSGLELQPGFPGVKVNLQAVSRGDRNADWSAATPTGSMSMTVNNPVAAQAWEDFMQESRRTGKSPEVFIDIYPSTDGWAGDGHLFRPGIGVAGTAYDERYCGECGQAKDAELTEYDYEKGVAVPKGKVHPNG